MDLLSANTKIQKSIYRFSCDKEWEVQQDSSYDSIENAIEQLPDQYRNVKHLTDKIMKEQYPKIYLYRRIDVVLKQD
jgi:hypothetical protein